MVATVSSLPRPRFQAFQWRPHSRACLCVYTSRCISCRLWKSSWSCWYCERSKQIWDPSTWKPDMQRDRSNLCTGAGQQEGVGKIRRVSKQVSDSSTGKPDK
eukprot:359832-Chlamydomonas_euryale.AAC.19